MSFDAKLPDWSKAEGAAKELFGQETPLKCMDPYVVTGIDTSWVTDETPVGESLKDMFTFRGIACPLKTSMLGVRADLVASAGRWAPGGRPDFEHDR